MLPNFFVPLALVGFFASLVVHIAAVFGFPTHVYVPLVWALHFGAMLVFVVAMFELHTGGIRKDFWKYIPRVFLVVLLATFGYCLCNFHYCANVMPQISHDRAHACIEPSAFMRSTPNPEFMSAEELRDQSIVDRTFTGHWMFFYLFSFMALTSSSLIGARRIS